MDLTRRRWLAVSTSAGLSGGIGMPWVGRAEAAEFVYKFANNLPDTHPMNVRAREMAAAIKEETDGRFDLRIFPSSQLGSDSDTLSQVRSGGVDFFTLSPLILSTLIPSVSISGMGFAFSDYEAVWKAMDGDLGNFIRQQISKAGIVAMEKIWDSGFRQMTSATKPIVTPEDLRGFKMRVPPSPLWTSMFKAFDAAPTSINFNEVYSSLQTRVVDGEENPLAIIATAKLNEVQKYCSVTNHMWDGFWFLANRKSWERIPQTVRDVVGKHINASGLKEREDVARLNHNLRQDLSDKGLIFNQTDPSVFREKLRKAGFYGYWQARYGEEAWATLEKTTGRLS